MKLLIIFLFIWFAYSQAPTSFTQIRDTVSCLSCFQNTFTTKICRPSPSYSTLNCCDSSDDSFDCGGGTLGVCSDDPTIFPYRSSLIMCPQEWSCNSQYYYLYNEYEYTIMSNYVPLGGVCWYKVSKYDQSYDGIRIYNLYSRNVTVSVYTAKSDGSYIIQDFSFSAGDDFKIPVSGYDGIYVVASSDSARIGKFQFSASLYKTPLSAGAIAGIVIGCVAFCIIFLIAMICCIKCCKKKIQKRKEAKLSKQNYQNIAQNTNMPIAPNYNNAPVYPIGTQLGYDKQPLLQNNQNYDGRTQPNMNPYMNQERKF